MGDIVGRLFREFAITGGGDSDFGGGLADPDADDVRADVKPRIAAQTKPLSRASERFFERVIAVYGRWLSRVLNHPWLTLSVALSTGVIDSAVGLYPERLLPNPDNGIIQGTLQARSRCRSPVWRNASSRYPI